MTSTTATILRPSEAPAPARAGVASTRWQTGAMALGTPATVALAAAGIHFTAHSCKDIRHHVIPCGPCAAQDHSLTLCKGSLLLQMLYRVDGAAKILPDACFIFQNTFVDLNATQQKAPTPLRNGIHTCLRLLVRSSTGSATMNAKLHQYPKLLSFALKERPELMD